MRPSERPRNALILRFRKPQACATTPRPATEITGGGRQHRQVVICQADQDFEPGPAQPLAVNPPDVHPHYHFTIMAMEAGCNAMRRAWNNLWERGSWGRQNRAGE